VKLGLILFVYIPAQYLTLKKYICGVFIKFKRRFKSICYKTVFRWVVMSPLGDIQGGPKKSEPQMLYS